MPIYTQQCIVCDHVFEHYRTISNYDKNPICEKCYNNTKRLVTQPVTQKDWDKPIISEAMACSPQDAKQREKLTGVKHTATGEPIFHNRAERSNFMKKLGFHDRAGYFSRHG